MLTSGKGMIDVASCKEQRFVMVIVSEVRDVQGEADGKR
jgi:hypothetical protein